jgi:hypothetical protein
MGARVNFVFKTEEDMPNIVLYSHWGETTWQQDLAYALGKAQNRLDMGDISYALRIIIDQLTKDGRDSETGYGIYLAKEDEMYWDTTVEIDMTKQLVKDDGSWHTFQGFISYQEEVLEYHSIV